MHGFLPGPPLGTTLHSMRFHHWIVAPLALAFLVRGGDACVEALTLPEMVAKTDAAVLGTVVDVHAVRWQPEDDDRLIYTVVTVEGEDLYTGKRRTLEAAFLGGVHQGEAMLVTSMPAPSEYRIGNEVLVFSAPVEGWGPDVDRCMYAAMGGIFRAIDTRGGKVLLGKGEGAAVSRNLRLADLRAGIADARREGGQ